MSTELLDQLWVSFYQTIWMVAVAGGIGTLIGLPIGIFLYITDKSSFLPMPRLNSIVGLCVNILRSVPFIILLFAVTGFTRFIVGTSIGTAAAIVPLTIAVAPFIGRIVEASLREVPYGLIEAAQSMGATNVQIIRKVLIPEALPGIISGLTLSAIALIGYSAMAGAVGGGGLGDLAINYGYYRYNNTVSWIVVVVLVVMVQAIQSAGDSLIRRISHK